MRSYSSQRVVGVYKTAEYCLADTAIYENLICIKLRVFLCLQTLISNPINQFENVPKGNRRGLINVMMHLSLLY